MESRSNLTPADRVRLVERVAAERNRRLEHATRIRSYRADLKQRLKAREVTLRDVLDGVNVDVDLILTMRAIDVLSNLPGYGRTTAAAIMKAARVGLDARLEALTDRQAAALLDRVEPCPTCGRLRS